MFSVKDKQLYLFTYTLSTAIPHKQLQSLSTYKLLASKAYNRYCLAFYRKCLPTPDL